MSMSKATILIVEDEAIVAADLAGKLGRLGYRISGTTGRGEDAIDRVRELQPDLVLMDIRLAGAMDGIEAAHLVRQEFGLPVIFLTAHSDRATLERAKLSEPFGYLLKPFDDLGLETHIEMALYKHLAERKLRQAHDELELRVQERTKELRDAEKGLREMNESLERRVAERTGELSTANATLRDSRLAALNMMEDAVAARRLAEEVGADLRRAEEKTHRQNALLKGINQILESALSGSEEELGAVCLAVAETVTGSKFGFIGELGEDGLLHDIAFSGAGWELCSMHDKSGHGRPPGDFQLHGLYGRVMLDGKGFFANEPASHPGSIGIPEVHPPLTAFLGVPLLRDGKSIGMIAVGNREGGYRQEELEALEALAPSMVQAYQRKRAEDALRGSEAQYHSLFDSLIEGFCIIEMLFDADDRPVDYRFLEINPSFEAQTGMRDAQGRRMRELAPEHEAHWFEIYGKVALTGEAASFVNEAKALDRWYEVSAYRVGGQDSRKVAILFNDITQSRQSKEALLHAKEAAEAANRIKSQFLANMSHELRTPMTGVLGMLDLALAGKLQPQEREFIGSAHSSAHSLVRILNDILDLTRIEKGVFSFEEKPFDIRRNLKNIQDLLFPVALGKGIEVAFSVAEDVPQTLIGDQTRLSQVLTNLAGNAVKFTEKGKVEVWVRAGESRADGKRDVTFAVIDTGIGIAEDKMHLLFREFSQVDDSHSRSYGGTGLGLAISKEIVERMGGTIALVSQEGKGSTFSFTVPLGEASVESDLCQALELAAPLAAAPRAKEVAKQHLLVAEDDPTIREVLGGMLRRTNYEVEFAENGRQAVALWERGIYDLILMDVQMPLMNGFEAVSAIREKERASGRHIPIIAMTAHALKEDEERCLGAGMDAYISKPIDFKKTLQLIKKTLGNTGTDG
jgi:signal transduction histidine kinase/DNA-binding response OmpR family regulator